MINLKENFQKDVKDLNGLNALTILYVLIGFNFWNLFYGKGFWSNIFGVIGLIICILCVTYNSVVDYYYLKNKNKIISKVSYNKRRTRIICNTLFMILIIVSIFIKYIFPV